MKNAEEKKYSISEFAKACGTTKDTLYHYEKQGILVPSFDENNHYRLYSTSDFHVFQYIAHLRRQNLSVSDIRDCMQNRDVKTYMKMLEISRQKCLEEISHLQHRYNIISSALDATAKYSNIPLETPTVNYSEEIYYYASPYSAKFDSLDGIKLFQQHLVAADSLPTVTSNIAVFHITRGSLKEGYSPKMMLMTQADDPSAVPEEHLHKKPEGRYLQIFFRTDFFSAAEDELRRYARIMTDYAEDHNYTVNSDLYCILHIGTFLSDDPKEYLTEFLFGIE